MPEIWRGYFNFNHMNYYKIKATSVSGLSGKTFTKGQVVPENFFVGNPAALVSAGHIEKCDTPKPEMVNVQPQKTGKRK